jgi:hypothetical protein
MRQPIAVLRNARNGTFAPEPVGAPLATPRAHRALLPVDLEPDGDLDLLLTTLDGPPVLLRNDSPGGHWIAVRLDGRPPNRDGIGATVLIEAGGRTQRREVRRSASFAGSVLPVVHAGLGAETTVARLEVRWPGGATTVLEDVPADRVLAVQERP